MRDALGIDGGRHRALAGRTDHAILLAPADLLWNGGIGTYVKASTETHTDVGDKANDAVRVDGADLRVKVVGEGGNLGVTQLGRIEFARAGGRINTDAIDNSAGVDTCDHEVNIKIALQHRIRTGDLDETGRRDPAGLHDRRSRRPGAWPTTAARTGFSESPGGMRRSCCPSTRG